ncbi:MAG TPA: hypothetical protein VEA59_01300 [Patescibacteria group bacterium]|nr:hypothetical protein [Patescibacteria group bacterium]
MTMRFFARHKRTGIVIFWMLFLGIFFYGSVLSPASAATEKVFISPPYKIESSYENTEMSLEKDENANARANRTHWQQGGANVNTTVRAKDIVPLTQVPWSTEIGGQSASTTQSTMSAEQAGQSNEKISIWSAFTPRALWGATKQVFTHPIESAKQIGRSIKNVTSPVLKWTYNKILKPVHNYVVRPVINFAKKHPIITAVVVTALVVGVCVLTFGLPAVIGAVIAAAQYAWASALVLARGAWMAGRSLYRAGGYLIKNAPKIKKLVDAVGTTASWLVPLWLNRNQGTAPSTTSTPAVNQTSKTTRTTTAIDSTQISEAQDALRREKAALAEQAAEQAKIQRANEAEARRLKAIADAQEKNNLDQQEANKKIDRAVEKLSDAEKSLQEKDKTLKARENALERKEQSVAKNQVSNTTSNSSTGNSTSQAAKQTQVSTASQPTPAALQNSTNTNAGSSFVGSSKQISLADLQKLSQQSGQPLHFDYTQGQAYLDLPDGTRVAADLDGSIGTAGLLGITGAGLTGTYATIKKTLNKKKENLI